MVKEFRNSICFPQQFVNETGVSKV